VQLALLLLLIQQVELVDKVEEAVAPIHQEQVTTVAVVNQAFQPLFRLAELELAAIMAVAAYNAQAVAVLVLVRWAVMLQEPHPVLAVQVVMVLLTLELMLAAEVQVKGKERLELLEQAVAVDHSLQIIMALPILAVEVAVA
jgi:hypothetical protein